jgi:hypothetical protein
MTLEILTKAINEYQNEGIELMKRLGNKFGYDITIKEQYEELIWKGNSKVPRKGKLSEKSELRISRWRMSFSQKKDSTEYRSYSN